MSIKLESEIVAQPFIDAEIQYFQVKVSKVEHKIVVFDTKDRLKHLQKCMEMVNNNIQNLDREIGSFQLRGSVNYSLEYKRDRFGCIHGHEYQYRGMSNISHDYHLTKDSFSIQSLSNAIY